MSRQSVTGTRIRERRLDKGLRQADVAESVGISASYLNLIEHNKRRIGGRLLARLAEVLAVDSSALTSGADAATLDGMRAAAARLQSSAEIDRAEDLAARYPGWASLVAEQEVRIHALEAEVQILTDRLSQDPALAEALHNVITAVTSIRATAGILVSGERVDADWQSRFHVNIHDDSRKLAEESQALVAYLDQAKSTSQNLAPRTVFDQVDAVFEKHPHLIATISEQPETPIDEILSGAAIAQIDRDVLAVAKDRLAQLALDAIKIPSKLFEEAVLEIGPKPDRLAQQFDVELDAVFRRLAYLPAELGLSPMGLMVCDAAGAITTLKAVPGFGLHRRATSCPLWPVFDALINPYRPCMADVVLPDPNETRFRCYAIATSSGSNQFDAPPRVVSTMLVVSDPPPDQATPRPVGSSCRICPRKGCQSRREPSVIDA